MADEKPKRHVRTEFRKNRTARTRDRNLTRRVHQEGTDTEQGPAGERVTGKGTWNRRRTVVTTQAGPATDGLSVQPDADAAQCLSGVVIRCTGLHTLVRTADGQLYPCATRRLLKTLSTEQRHVVVVGDRVLFRPSGADHGIIERIESRHGVLSRTSRGRQHVIVANVDQVLIVTSAAEPVLKPNLIDRLLVTAEKSAIRPVVCINKIDLVDAAELQPLCGVYGQMGYTVLLVSATQGWGIPRLRQLIQGKQTAVVGQSGVGKSSLLNAIQPGLGLLVRDVSEDTEKGRHTTTTAELIPLDMGGYLVDTPGVRQFQLWDITPAEMVGFFRDLRPYASLCHFPDCTHTHEAGCAIKDAVADGQLDARRYESYCYLQAGDEL